MVSPFDLHDLSFDADQYPSFRHPDDMYTPLATIYPDTTGRLEIDHLLTRLTLNPSQTSGTNEFMGTSAPLPMPSPPDRENLAEQLAQFQIDMKQSLEGGHSVVQ